MASIENTPKSPAAVLAALYCFSAGPVGFAIQKYLTAWFSPASIIAVQMTIGAAALWAVMLSLPWQSVSLSDRLKPFAVGIIHPGIFMIIFTTASRSMDGVTLILLSAFMPAVVVGLAARVFLGEPLKATTFLGMVVGFAGLLLAISERQITGESSLAGYVTALLALKPCRLRPAARPSAAHPLERAMDCRGDDAALGGGCRRLGLGDRVRCGDRNG